MIFSNCPHLHVNEVPALVPFPYGRLLVSPTTEDNLIDIRPVRPVLVLVVRSERKVDVVTCHHWGKQLGAGLGSPSKKTCW